VTPDELESKVFSEAEIAAEVRRLRQGRRWTQAELARLLDMSQSRLSQVERGDGALTAAQFLRVLAAFNVGAERFVRGGADDGAGVQNALARHGATHLVQTPGVVPSGLDDVTALVVRVLADPLSPRHVTALAPVVVANLARVHLGGVAAGLAPLGRARRVAWLAESLDKALTIDRPSHAPDRLAAKRAATVLSLFLESASVQVPDASEPLDVLDAEVRSLKSAVQVFAEASEEARRWRVVTRLCIDDFVHALRSARESRAVSSR